MNFKGHNFKLNLIKSDTFIVVVACFYLKKKVSCAAYVTKPRKEVFFEPRHRTSRRR